MVWPIEVIPDGDHLYKRVHRDFIKGNGIPPRAFTNRPKGSKSMSVDWAKYSTPEESRARAKEPTKNAVVEAAAGQVRAVPGQIVEHSPIEKTRSHSGVTGEKTTKVRVLLSRIFIEVIPLEQNPQEAGTSNL